MSVIKYNYICIIKINRSFMILVKRKYQYAYQ